MTWFKVIWSMRWNFKLSLLRRYRKTLKAGLFSLHGWSYNFTLRRVSLWKLGNTEILQRSPNYLCINLSLWKIHMYSNKSTSYRSGLFLVVKDWRTGPSAKPPDDLHDAYWTSMSTSFKQAVYSRGEGQSNLIITIELRYSYQRIVGYITESVSITKGRAKTV